MLWLCLVRLLYSPARISFTKFSFKSPHLTWRSSAAGKQNITFMVKPYPQKNKPFTNISRVVLLLLIIMLEKSCQTMCFVNQASNWKYWSCDFCKSEIVIKLFSFLPSVDFPSSTLTLPPSAITAKEPNTLKLHDINFEINLTGFGCIKLKSKRKGFQHLYLLRFAEHTSVHNQALAMYNS